RPGVDTSHRGRLRHFAAVHFRSASAAQGDRSASSIRVYKRNYAFSIHEPKRNVDGSEAKPVRSWRSSQAPAEHGYDGTQRERSTRGSRRPRNAQRPERNDKEYE